MADLNINVSDSVTTGESTNIYLLSIAKSETISVGESIDLDILLAITESDSVSLGESLEAHIGYPVDVSEAVSVSESVTVEIPGVFYIDERYIPKWPVWSLEASFPIGLQPWNLRRPFPSLEGCFGAILDEKAPVHDLDASISVDTYILDLDTVAPSFTGEGYFGAILDTKSPHYEISASFEEIYYAVLDRVAPFWKVEGEILGPLTFSLDKKMPVRMLSISMSPDSIPMTLDGKRSMYRITAAGYNDLYIWLDENMPIRTIDAAMYSGEMWLDAIMPARIMQAIGSGETGPPPSVISDDTRFTDYILRYRRP